MSTVRAITLGAASGLATYYVALWLVGAVGLLAAAVVLAPYLLRRGEDGEAMPPEHHHVRIMRAPYDWELDQ